MTNLEKFDAANAAAITAERGKSYGHPGKNFERIAGFWDLISDCPDPRIRHALSMICVKISRLCVTPDHLDSAIDIAGYARTIVMCNEPETT